MYILGFHVGPHDSAACLFKDHKLVAFCKEERLTRIKNCGKDFKLLSIDEVLRIGGITRKDVDAVALSRYHIPAECYIKKDRFLVEKIRQLRGKQTLRKLFRVMKRADNYNEEEIINFNALRKWLKVRDDTEIHFINHHYSHILGAFKYTPWQDGALYVSCDGGGDFAYYVAYYYNGKELECLCGEDLPTFKNPQNEGASIGLAYCSTTELLGFRPNRHEGKVTGLSAFGKPVAGEEICNFFKVLDNCRVDSELTCRNDLDEALKTISDRLTREEMAASIQYATEKVVLEWVKKLVEKRPVKYIGMSGGVFSNVLLNQKVAELPGIEETYVFPPMGDEGLPVGHCVATLIEKFGADAIERDYMRDVYLGYPYNADDLVQEAKADNLIVRENIDVVKVTAKLLEKHYIGALFAQRMEMGPRALGARSILANPSDKGINDSLNKRLERTEFMPFAPYVLDVDADEVFDIHGYNRLPSRFMTITTNVKEKYHPMIPAVVHIDGTARPQIVYREDNPIYYDILKEFKELTGMPCLVNTSFNAHEEPIINKPSEALNALKADRIDFLICEKALIFKHQNVMDEVVGN